MGKRAELIVWEKARDTFARYGSVTPRIPKRADMERFSTMAALDRQKDIVQPVFDQLYKLMFDTTDPLRPHLLHGFHLTENVLKAEAQAAKSKSKNQDITHGKEDTGNQ